MPALIQIRRAPERPSKRICAPGAGVSAPETQVPHTHSLGCGNAPASRKSSHCARCRAQRRESFRARCDGRGRGCGQSAAKTRCKGTRKQCGGVWTTHSAHRTQLHSNRPNISTVLHGGTETHPVHRADVRRPPLKIEALLLVAIVLRHTFVEVGVQSVAVFCLGTRKINGFAKTMSSKTLVLTKSRGLQRGLTGVCKGVAKGLQRGCKGV
jgi:hypothetical protein